MRGQLYRGHANATALFSSPVVSALGSESDDPGSSPDRGKTLRRAGKKMRAPLLGLAKYILFRYTHTKQLQSYTFIELKSVLFLGIKASSRSIAIRGH